MRVLLKPVELAYRGVAGTRRKLYRTGSLRSRRLPRPVISVGNISFGGSGKTPVVLAIASEFVRLGCRVAVLSRGYRRGGRDLALVNDNSPSLYGDEPVLISRSVPGAAVIVGADRHAAGTMYLRDQDCDVFLLDDGFQHLQLHRDLDVVIDDPRGQWLRESRSALRDADIILSRNAGGESAAFTLDIIPTTLVRNDQTEPLESVHGKRVLAFAGLADNSQFFETCRRLGADLVGIRSFRDHHRYTSAEIEKLRLEAARRGAMLLTTEKDFVKLDVSGMAFVRVEARITPRDEFFRRLTVAIGGYR